MLATEPPRKPADVVARHISAIPDRSGAVAGSGHRRVLSDPAAARRSRLAAGRHEWQQAYAQAQPGLDRPVLTQLSIYLGFAPGTAPGLRQGSLGQSWVTGSAVTADIAAYLPVTIERITLSFAIAFVIAVPVGMLSALRSGGCHRSARCRRRSPGSCWLIQCWPDNQGSSSRRRIIRCCRWPT